MRGLLVLGIVLLLGGVAMLIWPSFTVTTTEEVLDVGPVEVTTEDLDRVALPPAIGIGAAIAGVALIVIGSRRTGRTA